MKALRNIFFFVVMMPVLGLINGCSDPGAVFDRSNGVENHNWSYANRIKYDVKIDDASIPYNLYVNLRVTADYRYSNIFVLVRRNGPKLKGITRYEIKLANPDGEWLGEGSGNLYSYQVPFQINYKFPDKGVYHFEIEQNMRDNPLHEVSDVGLRVEKANGQK